MGERYEIGMKVRREVNGDDVIDRIEANTDDFSRPMQDLVTEYCWGEVWSRPDLDRRSRSILNIGMLAALNRPEALAGHIRGGISNGLSKAEIRECLLQVAIYVGMPAGLACFEVARKALADVED
ncbi:carboxymuconolactone decarboxylase family protein [Rhodococcus koreensis]